MNAVRKLASTQGYGALCATMSDESLVAFARQLVGYRGDTDTRQRVLAVARVLAAHAGVDLDAAITEREKDELWDLLRKGA